MKRFTYLFATLAIVLVAGVSCTKEISKVLPSNECSVLDIRVYGQLGKAEIERIDDENGLITIFINKTSTFPWANVKVEAIALSARATSDLGPDSTLDFYNPDRSAVLRVTSQTGKSVDWTIQLKPYDAFYVGVWQVIDAKIYVDQNISGCGTAAWETQISGDEFGYYASAELDNVITIRKDDEMLDGKFTGTITNDAGLDGQYGQFKAVWPGEYEIEKPLDMTSRLRHLIPEGESTWVLDLATNEMKITKNNITSTMTFETDSWGNMVFAFKLPNASSDPEGSNFFNNFWRSSYKFTYIVNPLR